MMAQVLLRTDYTLLFTGHSLTSVGFNRVAGPDMAPVGPGIHILTPRTWWRDLIGSDIGFHNACGNRAVARC